MKTKKMDTVAVLLTLFVFFLGDIGCRSRVQNLTTAAIEKIETEPRDVQITWIEIVDVRSEEQKIPLDPNTQYFVPAIVVFRWSKEGNLRTDSRYVSKNVSAEMQQLMRDTLEQSKLIKSSPSPNALKAGLRISITDLYGTTHASTVGTVVYLLAGGIGITKEKTFAPYGFAAAKVELVAENGNLLFRRHLTGSFSPDSADLLGLNYQMKGKINDRLSRSAVLACGSLATNVVKALEPALANYAALPERSIFDRSSFIVSRATEDGIHLELASINKANGEILASVVGRRWMEPYQAVNEWVVDPYQNGTRRLSDKEYEKLVKSLKDKYIVQYVTDTRVAHFFGMKK